jgi:methylated-DNA-[protein]-cysteine S-methyltransferase
MDTLAAAQKTMKTSLLPVATLHFDGPLGGMRLAASARGLCGVWFAGQRHGPDATGWPDDPRHPLLLAAQAQLTAYLRGERPGFDLPLDLAARGTAFQQAVWQALRAIPRGSTHSYAALAQAVGRPAAVRAVGAAVGRNPLSVVVPCHRVLGSDGSLTGYAGGLERKRALLALEGVR